jgi:hypothetical protein
VARLPKVHPTPPGVLQTIACLPEKNLGVNNKCFLAWNVSQSATTKVAPAAARLPISHGVLKKK